MKVPKKKPTHNHSCEQKPPVVKNQSNKKAHHDKRAELYDSRPPAKPGTAVRREGSPDPPKGASASSCRPESASLPPSGGEKSRSRRPDPSPEASAPVADGERREWPKRFSKSPPRGCRNATTKKAASGTKFWIRCCGSACSPACRRLFGGLWQGGFMLGVETWPDLAPQWEARISQPPRLAFGDYRRDLTKILRILGRRDGGFAYATYMHFKHGRLHLHLVVRTRDSPAADALLAEIREAADRVRPKGYGARQLHLAPIEDLARIISHLAEQEHRQEPEPLPAAYKGKAFWCSRDFLPRNLTELVEEARRRREVKRRKQYAARRAERKLIARRVRQMIADRQEDYDLEFEALTDGNPEIDPAEYGYVYDPDADELRAMRATIKADREEERKLKARFDAMTNPPWGKGLTREEIEYVRYVDQWAHDNGKQPLDYVVACVDVRLYHAEERRLQAEAEEAARRERELRDERDARRAAARTELPVLRRIPLKLKPYAPTAGEMNEAILRHGLTRTRFNTLCDWRDRLRKRLEDGEHSGDPDDLADARFRYAALTDQIEAARGPHEEADDVYRALCERERLARSG